MGGRSCSPSSKSTWRTRLSRMMKSLFDHPPVPLPGQEGGIIISGGHPQTPARGGATPSGLPFVSTLLLVNPKYTGVKEFEKCAL